MISEDSSKALGSIRIPYLNQMVVQRIWLESNNMARQFTLNVYIYRHLPVTHTYMWNQGSSYLIYWQLGAWFQTYRELEDQGMCISIHIYIYLYVYLQNIAQSSSSFFQQASMLKSQLLKR